MPERPRISIVGRAIAVVLGRAFWRFFGEWHADLRSAPNTIFATFSGFSGDFRVLRVEIFAQRI